MICERELAEIGIRFDNEGEPYNESAAKLCESHAELVKKLAKKIGCIVEMPELLGRERVTDALLEILDELKRDLSI